MFAAAAVVCAPWICVAVSGFAALDQPPARLDGALYAHQVNRVFGQHDVRRRGPCGKSAELHDQRVLQDPRIRAQRIDRAASSDGTVMGWLTLLHQVRSMREIPVKSGRLVKCRRSD